MPLPPASYAALPARLASRQAQASAAYLVHAADPGLHNGFDAWFKLWAAANEARAELAEQNPAFADLLLPGAGVVPGSAIGLPRVPAGVRWAVDEAGPGLCTVTVDVAGPVSVDVVVPGVGSAAVTAQVSHAPTRATITFPARPDGLYLVTLGIGGAQLVTLFIPVTRTLFRQLREQSRALGYGLSALLPRPGPDYLARLARLIGAEAAARSGRPDLALRALASAGRVPTAPSPTANFPRRAPR